MKWILFAFCCCFISCASLPTIKSVAGHDEQFIQIFFHHGHCNELDTFHGTYQKDLVSKGTIKAAMWLKKRDQEILLSTLHRLRFFNLPDTIPKQHDIIVDPDMGVQILKVKYGGTIKTVVWYETNEPSFENDKYSIEEISRLLVKIIYSTPEYKAMPVTDELYL
jgi:hypothetical protein